MKQGGMHRKVRLALLFSSVAGRVAPTQASPTRRDQRPHSQPRHHHTGVLSPQDVERQREKSLADLEAGHGLWVVPAQQIASGRAGKWQRHEETHHFR